MQDQDQAAHQSSPESLAQEISAKLDELIAMVDEEQAQGLQAAKAALAQVSGEAEVEPADKGQMPMSGGPGSVPAY